MLLIAVSGAVAALVVALFSARRLNFSAVDFPRRQVENEQRSTEITAAETILRKKIALLRRKEQIARQTRTDSANPGPLPALLERPAEMDDIDAQLELTDQEWEREQAAAAAAAAERIAQYDTMRRTARRIDIGLLAVSLLLLLILGSAIVWTWVAG